MRFCKREIEKYRYFAKMAFAGAVCLLMCAGCGEIGRASCRERV